MQQVLSNGLTTIFNGLHNALDGISNPFVIAGVVVGVALAWMARLEVAELDRQGAKPHVKRH